MINKYRHKKTRLIVEWRQDFEVYASKSDTHSYFLPKDVVEQSTEWEVITPLFDFFGAEVNEDELHYRVVLCKDCQDLHTTHVLNGKNGLSPEHKVAKVLAIFRDYEKACEFQRIFVALNKAKDLLATPLGNPSAYLKNTLSIIRAL